MARTIRNNPGQKWMRTPKHIGALRQSISAREALAEFNVTDNRINSILARTVTNWDDINIAARSETRQNYRGGSAK